MVRVGEFGDAGRADGGDDDVVLGPAPPASLPAELFFRLISLLVFQLEVLARVASCCASAFVLGKVANVQDDWLGEGGRKPSVRVSD